MSYNKPWIMFQSKEEIGQTIQIGLAEKLQRPVGVKFEDEELVFVLQLPGNQAHIRVSMQDLKNSYANPGAFIEFIDSCWQESLKGI
ncbi:hypothetical protein [Ammoniphilus sp. YIM 78166]|uniref:hypothetical protein n=1 Tax=Ammoniphilus sp. YIM 78166 TaxID=1644106 RepID=UPI00106FB61B|nr:hypothetical protein [Ammoniphilus sp. YIM 78166]